MTIYTNTQEGFARALEDIWGVMKAAIRDDRDPRVLRDWWRIYHAPLHRDWREMINYCCGEDRIVYLQQELADEAGRLSYLGYLFI